MPKASKRHKKFSGGQSLNEYPPLSFTLNDQEFNCRPAIQGKTLLQFVAQADSDRGGQAAQAIYEFFSKAMYPEDYERFMEMLEDPDTIVSMELIGEIATWLVEEYTGRPTQPAETSANGQSTSGRTSTAAASSAASG